MNKHIHQTHSGSGDNIGRDKVINIFGNTLEYQHILKDIEFKEKYLSRIPKEETVERMEASVILNEAKRLLEEFKDNIIRLAETFNKIEINSDRIQIAKAQFEIGSFSEANLTLNAEDLKFSQELLLKRKKEEESKLDRQLEINAEEWLIKARLTALNYGSTNRYKDAKSYFESAFLSYSNPKNLLEYAIFLEENLQFAEAYEMVSKAELLFSITSAELIEKDPQNLTADILWLKGKLEITLEMYTQAENSYKSSLALNNELSRVASLDTRQLQMKILNGLSSLYLKVKNFQSAISYADQAISFYEEKHEDLLEMKAEYGFSINILCSAIAYSADPYDERPLSEKLKINNQIKKHKENYIKIFEELSKINPDKFTREVIDGLEYKARYANAEGNTADAKKYFLKGIELAKKQSERNPEIYLPILSRGLQAYGEFQFKSLKNHQQAHYYTEQALKIIEDLHKTDPEAYLYRLAILQQSITATTEDVEMTYYYANEAYSNLKYLINKNPILYQEDFILNGFNVFLRLKDLKEFEKAENFLLDLQEYILNLINQSQSDELYRYLNSFYLLSKMYKVDFPQKLKSLFYANLGLEKIEIGYLSAEDSNDIKSKMTNIISDWK